MALLWSGLRLEASAALVPFWSTVTRGPCWPRITGWPTPGPKEALAHTRFAIREVNWLEASDQLNARDQLHVKMRSLQQPVAAKAEGGDGGLANITLLEPHEGIAPGQACVMYDGDRVLGGGWISTEHLARI